MTPEQRAGFRKMVAFASVWPPNEKYLFAAALDLLNELEAAEATIAVMREALAAVPSGWHAGAWTIQEERASHDS